jgi:hypothetical protein
MEELLVVRNSLGGVDSFLTEEARIASTTKLRRTRVGTLLLLPLHLALFLGETFALEALLAVHFVFKKTGTRSLARSFTAGTLEAISMVWSLLEEDSLSGVHNFVAHLAVGPSTAELRFATSLTTTLLGGPLDLALLLGEAKGGEALLAVNLVLILSSVSGISLFLAVSALEALHMIGLFLKLNSFSRIHSLAANGT